VTRAVFFDIGDTLVHRPTVGPGRRIAAALGLPADAARAITRVVFRERLEDPAALARRLADLLGIDTDVTPLIAEIWHAQETEPVEVPGATACIADVVAAGSQVGVISNIWAPYAAGFRRACPAIVPRIASWHLSYLEGTAKPDATLFRRALAALDVHPADAIMVGDSLAKDIEPALRLGMAALWVPALAPDGAAATDAAAAATTAVGTGGAVVATLDEARALLRDVLREPAPPRVSLSAAGPRAIDNAGSDQP
jgi:putative hydrolase of the HAD superfamily